MDANRQGTLRLAAITLTTLLGLSLMFALHFIQVRNSGIEHKRQLNYGELARVQHQLRDWTDVLRERVRTRTATPTGEVAVAASRAIEDVPGSAGEAPTPRARARGATRSPLRRARTRRRSGWPSRAPSGATSRSRLPPDAIAQARPGSAHKSISRRY